MGKRPRLAPEVTDLLDSNTGLLLYLADDGLFQCLARLDETS
jgi:hypothetical protein